MSLWSKLVRSTLRTFLSSLCTQLLVNQWAEIVQTRTNFKKKRKSTKFTLLARREWVAGLAESFLCWFAPLAQSSERQWPGSGFPSSNVTLIETAKIHCIHPASFTCFVVPLFRRNYASWEKDWKQWGYIINSVHVAAVIITRNSAVPLMCIWRAAAASGSAAKCSKLQTVNRNFTLRLWIGILRWDCECEFCIETVNRNFALRLWMGILRWDCE